MKVLVTGVAGFIGMHVSKCLLEQSVEVVGIDNLNNYYDIKLKEDRLKCLLPFSNFHFYHLDISDRSSMEEIFNRECFQRVYHLAAQAGVRYSLKNPYAYINSNIVGFLNILEGCRNNRLEHLIYASSSSVYGSNTHMPFRVQDNTDHPVSLYAATKKSNELMAHTYSSLYNLPTTGLRFFTVYGPWGRPDMSPSLFAKAIFEGTPIDVYNYGKMQRDFTYIDDIVQGIVRVAEKTPKPDLTFDRSFPDSSKSYAPFRLYNIGNHQPVELISFIHLMEDAVGMPATLNMLPMQAGDVVATYADIEDLMRDVDFRPHTPIHLGVKKFVEWYRTYYGHL